MNSIIGKSKIRQKILMLLFANESRNFYLSEIARIAGTSAGNTQRELEKLVREGIVSSENKAGLHYYVLDKKNPVFKDVENIVRKTIGIETELAGIFSTMKGIQFAFIFGSYVKGESFKNDSDVDIIVIGNPNENELNRKITCVEKSIGREINYHLYTALSEFKRKIKKESFLANVIKKYKLIVGNKNEFKKIFR
jgi:predicted nucleotidyltransferase